MMTFLRMISRIKSIYSYGVTPSNSDFEKSNFPVSYGGKGGTNPSQNLIDDYEMLDGTAFDWNDPVKAAHPFENRDERLLATVLMNGVLFKGKRIATYPGGADAMPNLMQQKRVITCANSSMRTSISRRVEEAMGMLYHCSVWQKST